MRILIIVLLLLLSACSNKENPETKSEEKKSYTDVSSKILTGTSFSSLGENAPVSNPVTVKNKLSATGITPENSDNISDEGKDALITLYGGLKWEDKRLLEYYDITAQFQFNDGDCRHIVRKDEILRYRLQDGEYKQI